MTPRRILQESDELLFWVEECLVQEIRIVPSWLVARLMVVLRQAHPELPGRLGRERRPEVAPGERSLAVRGPLRRGAVKRLLAQDQLYVAHAIGFGPRSPDCPGT